MKVSIVMVLHVTPGALPDRHQCMPAFPSQALLGLCQKLGAPIWEHAWYGHLHVNLMYVLFNNYYSRSAQLPVHAKTSPAMLHGCQAMTQTSCHAQNALDR